MTQGRVTALHHLDEDETAELCEALGIPAQAVGWPLSEGGSSRALPAVLSTGLPHLVVPLLDRDVLMDIDLGRRAQVAPVCRTHGCDSAALVAPGSSGVVADADGCVRVVDPPELCIEADPATGSAAGPIAVFLGRLAGARDATWGVVLEQGAELGRPSRLRAEVDFGPDGRPGEVRVAGRVAPLIEGG